MATQDKSIKTFTGKRVSEKQYKLYLAKAKTPQERAAIKSLYLSEPLKYYSKKDEAAQTAADAISAALDS